MKWVICLCGVVCFVICGCTTTIQDKTRTQYMHESFSAADLSGGGLALLPVAAGRGQEGYRRPLGDLLNQHLHEAVPGGQVLTWQASMDSINNHGMVETYQTIIDNYQLTSIINKDLVRKLKSVLGVRYAMYCSLQDFSRGSTGVSPANVMAQCLVLDMESGDIAQEIIGQAQSSTTGWTKDHSYEEYATILAKSVLSQLPGSMVIAVDPAAEENAEDTDNRTYY